MALTRLDETVAVLDHLINRPRSNPGVGKVLARTL